MNMIFKFFKKTANNYGGQILAMLLFSFLVYGYISDIGFHNPVYTIKQFSQNSIPFFYKVIVESTYNYLFFLPFVIIPFLIFWVIFKKLFFKYRIQQIEKHTLVHFVHDIIESIFSTFAFVLLSMVQVKLADKGIIKLYDNFSDFPWYNVLIAAASWFVFEDTWFYWIHRAMHHKYIYKYVHASHHVSVDTTPFTQNAFNFVEGLLLPMGSIIPTFIFPSWGPAYFVFLIFGGTVNMIAHSGYEFYPKWTLFWKTTATHHNMHHQHFDGNYGTHFTFWDKICKTEFHDYEERFLEIKNRVVLKK
jgi:sterol desaturase/sphingolipid hydroxylase (fatty acid hydroxylase superfamily)